MKSVKHFSDLPDLEDLPIGKKVGYLRLTYGSREKTVPLFIVPEAPIFGGGVPPELGFYHDALKEAIRSFEPAATGAQAEEAAEWMTEMIYYHLAEGDDLSGEDYELTTWEPEEWVWPQPLKWDMIFYDWFVARRWAGGKDWSP